MDQKSSFNLTTDFFNGFSTIFMKLVIIIIAVYLFIMILNFLRDKFINSKTDTKNDDILELLTILNKLFFVSGFGFIVGNIFQVFFTRMRSGHDLQIMQLKGEWDYLTFGIIILFIGIGFKIAKNELKKERVQ